MAILGGHFDGKYGACRMHRLPASYCKHPGVHAVDGGLRVCSLVMFAPLHMAFASQNTIMDIVCPLLYSGNVIMAPSSSGGGDLFMQHDVRGTACDG